VIIACLRSAGRRRLISRKIVEQVFQPFIILIELVRLFEFTVDHFVSFIYPPLAASARGGAFSKPCMEIARGVTL